MVTCAAHRSSSRACIASVLAAAICTAPLVVTAESPSVALQSASQPPWSSLTPCMQGTLQCVDGVLTEMDKRFRGLAQSCDHDAVFALLYLRTTEEYRRTVAADPAFFADTAYVNREDALFAEDYFVAYDAWHTGSAAVPPSWAIAFEAAEGREVSGGGNILLGMNAHINRDLPFVLARLGLTHPDGSSRKPDHDKVNEILYRVAHGPVLDEAAQRFDPSIKSSDVPGTTLDNDAFFQLVVSWRERAWHNAVRLLSASTSLEWQIVAADIEQSAAAHALALKASALYTPPVSSTAARDAHCAAQ
jgi:hypothetical protein